MLRMLVENKYCCADCECIYQVYWSFVSEKIARSRRSYVEWIDAARRNKNKQKYE